MTFDLKKQNPADAAEAGYTFEVTTPAGDKTGIKISVRGEHSPAVRNHGRKVYQEMKMKEQQAKRKGREYELDLDEAEEMSVDAAVIRTIGWGGIVEDGKEVKFSKDEAKRVYAEYSWIREQVLEQSNNIFNFQ